MTRVAEVVLADVEDLEEEGVSFTSQSSNLSLSGEKGTEIAFFEREIPR